CLYRCARPPGGDDGPSRPCASSLFFVKQRSGSGIFLWGGFISVPFRSWHPPGRDVRASRPGGCRGCSGRASSTGATLGRLLPTRLTMTAPRRRHAPSPPGPNAAPSSSTPPPPARTAPLHILLPTPCCATPPA